MLKSICYLSCALGMVLFALPKLELGQGWSVAAVFGAAWISLALLIIAAHLRIVLRVDQTDGEPVRQARQS